MSKKDLSVIENKDIVTVTEKCLALEDVIAKAALVKAVMKMVMIKDTHYGTIPGCVKPSLYQAGAQQLATTFQLYPEPEIIDKIDTDHEFTIIVKISLYNPSGSCCGSIMGSCSSLEEKYAWRSAVCDEEFNTTPENKRRIKWKKGWQGKKPTQTNQVRTNPKDIQNTVIKMATKRGFVGAVLNATSASDIFTQDVEDLPDSILNQDNRDHQPQPAKGMASQGSQKPGAVKPPPEFPLKALFIMLNNFGFGDKYVALYKKYLYKKYAVESSTKLTNEQRLDQKTVLDRAKDDDKIKNEFYSHLASFEEKPKEEPVDPKKALIDTIFRKMDEFCDDRMIVKKNLKPMIPAEVTFEKNEDLNNLTVAQLKEVVQMVGVLYSEWQESMEGK